MTKTIYHRMKALNVRMAANYRRGIGPTRVVLLLTTTGRKSGLLRVTPLQYEKENDYASTALTWKNSARKRRWWFFTLSWSQREKSPTGRIIIFFTLPTVSAVWIGL